jgi:hypothetical protein
MASPATFRAPYLQRLEPVNDIIRAHSTLRGKGSKRFGVTCPHVLTHPLVEMITAGILPVNWRLQP